MVNLVMVYLCGVPGGEESIVSSDTKRSTVIQPQHSGLCSQGRTEGSGVLRKHHPAGVVGQLGVEEQGSSGSPERARGGTPSSVVNPVDGPPVTLAHVVGETDKQTNRKAGIKGCKGQNEGERVCDWPSSRAYVESK